MSDTRDGFGSTGVRLVAVSALCVGLGASLGFLPGFLATSLRDDLGVSRTQVGILVSVHFGCTGLGSIVGGRLTERFGARIVVIADMTIVALAATFSAVISAYWALLVTAVFAGFAYSLSNAGTNVAVGRAVPLARRTMAMSVKTAGVPLMAAIGGGVGPSLAAAVGWQPLLYATAVLAAAAAIVAALTFADDRPPSTEERTESVLPPGFVWYPVGAFLLIAGSQPLYSWTVAYLEQSLEAAPGVAGAISAGASVCGVGVMILSARFADRESPEDRLRRLVALVAINIGGTVLVLLGEFAGVTIVAVGVVIGISAQLAAIGTMHATVVDRAPEAIARATGITMTGYYIGALASPAAFGFIADATNTFVWSWGAATALLILALPTWSRAGRRRAGILKQPPEHSAVQRS